jgi:hypothetical protein
MTADFQMGYRQSCNRYKNILTQSNCTPTPSGNMSLWSDAQTPSDEYHIWLNYYAYTRAEMNGRVSHRDKYYMKISDRAHEDQVLLDWSSECKESATVMSCSYCSLKIDKRSQRRVWTIQLFFQIWNPTPSLPPKSEARDQKELHHENYPNFDEDIDSIIAEIQREEEGKPENSSILMIPSSR